MSVNNGLIVAYKAMGQSASDMLYQVCLVKAAYECAQSGEKWVCSVDDCEAYGNVDNCQQDQCISANAPDEDKYEGRMVCR